MLEMGLSSRLDRSTLFGGQATRLQTSQHYSVWVSQVVTDVQVDISAQPGQSIRVAGIFGFQQVQQIRFVLLDQLEKQGLLAFHMVVQRAGLHAERRGQLAQADCLETVLDEQLDRK